MQYEDRITIDTPEGVQLEITLAGLGSRFFAVFIDGLIQLAAILALTLAVNAIGSTGESWGPIALALYFIVAFLIYFGYFVLFEVLAAGRSPGKMVAGIRVVKVGGNPVDFRASAIRNIVRLVDMDFLFAVGIVSILATRRNQRLGDLAAGTLVVRDRKAVHATGRWGSPPPPPAPPVPQELPAWDVSTITFEELAAVRQFLERRGAIAADARWRIAAELAGRLRPKVGGAPDDMDPERFLEWLAVTKAART